MRKTAAGILVLTVLCALAFTRCNKVTVDCDYILRTMREAEKGGVRDTIGKTGVYVFHADTTTWKVLTYEDAIEGIITNDNGDTRRADMVGVQTVTGIYEFNFTRKDVMLLAYHTDYPVFGYRNANVVANLPNMNIPVVFQTWKVSDQSNPLRYTVRETGGGWTMVYEGTDTEAIDPDAPEGDDVGTLPYSVGFEPANEDEPGFSSGSTYNSEVKYNGPDGRKWGLFYATPSTLQPITGEQSLRMQWTTSKRGEWARASTTFVLKGLKEVAFDAHYTHETGQESSMNVRALHSTDKGQTWQGEEVFILSSAMSTYNYKVSDTGIDAMVRFSISVPEQEPTQAAFVLIDNVIFR